MIKKIDANKYGVVRYAISSIEDIADLPREVSVGSEAILVNEDGEKKFRLGSDGWVEVVEVKEYDEDKLRDILEDAKVGYGGIEYETLEERLDKDFDNAYSVLDNRAYVEYEGCRITAEDSLNGLQKETVIKGRTLQNLVDRYSYLPNQFVATCYHKKGMIKPSTTYTSVIYNYSSELLQIYINEVSFNYRLITVEPNKYRVDKFQSKSTLDTGSALFKNHITHELNLNYKVLFLEGDYTETPLEELPFIEGIESVGDKSKNLFDGVLLNNKINNTTGIIIDKYSNEHYSSDFIQCDSLKTYTVSVNYDDTVSEVMLFEYDNEKNFIKKNSKKGVNSLTVTLSNDTKYIRLSSFKGYGFNEYNFDFQLEEGTQATPYEPYYDGYKISGKSIGKNLFDINLCNTPSNNGLIFNRDNGELFVTGNSIGSYDIYIAGNNNKALKLGKYINNLPIGTTLKLSNNLGLRNFFGFINESGNVSYVLNSYTTKLNEKDIVCFVRIEAGQKFDNTQIKIQLEISSTPSTTYEPYKESTYSYILDEPLRSLPNGVCDEIDLEKGIVTRRVGKVVLDNSGTVTYEANASAHTEIGYAVSTNIVGKVGGVVISDKFVDSSVLDERIWLGVVTGRLTVKVSRSKFETENLIGFKKWIGENPVVAYYELANPTTEYLIKDDKFVTLPNGVKDEISHNSVLRKVGKVVLDGSKVYESLTEVQGIVRWGYNIDELKIGGSCICSMFDYVPVVQTWREPFKDGITINSTDAAIIIYMDKYKKAGQHVEEVRALLDGLEVYYELKAPYTEPINLNEVILDTIRLKSYEPITHITSDNYLPPTIKTQVPSDFNAVVLGLKSNNEELASQVMSLRQTNDELEVTNREQDDVIDVTLLALDEVYGMIDESEIETMSTGSPMVNVYVKMIKRGIKTLDEVPTKYRAEVEELI